MITGSFALETHHHHNGHTTDDDFPPISSEKLYVISVISNPKRYAKRYQLSTEFDMEMARHPNVEHYKVEMAYGNRPFEVTDPHNPKHIRVRSKQELWHKENLINIGIQHLPADAKYIAWIDADVRFMRYDWVEETIQQLQHYPIVQMFSHATLLGPTHAPDHHAISFAYAYAKSQASFDPKFKTEQLRFGNYGGTPYKTGLAWAFTREAIVSIGGMMDRCIIGSADYHMAASFIGRVIETIPDDSSEPYKKMILDWERVAYPIIKGNIGYVDGTLVHFWHGAMKDRRYKERWAIVNEFDPVLDLTYDWTNKGLIQLVDHGERTRQIARHLKEYFALRNEDAI